jgi:hypothetical protein
MKHSQKIVTSIITICISMAFIGCQTYDNMSKGGKGGLGGAGLGALAGQLIGGDTQATLIGAAAGAGLGYIIGNEKDKKDAQQPQFVPEYAPFAGTKWTVTKVTPAPSPAFKTLTIEFLTDGTLITRKTLLDDQMILEKESYRVSGGILIINQADYLINATYTMSGNKLTLNAEQFRAELMRM